MHDEELVEDMFLCHLISYTFISMCIIIIASVTRSDFAGGA